MMMMRIGVVILVPLPIYINKHPVAIDIAGTSETVNNTTKEMLEKFAIVLSITQVI